MYYAISSVVAYSDHSFFPVCGSFHFKPVFVCIFTVHADENSLENERNHIQERRNDLNMLLLWSTNSMSDCCSNLKVFLPATLMPNTHYHLKKPICMGTTTFSTATPEPKSIGTPGWASGRWWAWAKSLRTPPVRQTTTPSAPMFGNSTEEKQTKMAATWRWIWMAVTTNGSSTAMMDPALI